MSNKLTNSIKVVLMAGGSGKRFWPKSRENLPKQFLKIISNKTMIEETFERINSFIPKENIYIATNHKFYSLVKEIFPQLSNEQIILEPQKKDTAAAILYNILNIPCDDKSIFFFTPSDHYIRDLEKYKNCILQACKTVNEKETITLVGIEPNSPSTEYGYMKINSQKENEVIKFTEKPDIKTAIFFLQSKIYLWNSGMFFFNKKYILQQYERLLPNHLEKIEKYLSLDNEEEKEKIFSEIESISFDYAILEKSKPIYSVKGDFFWNDVGSWNSMHNIAKNKDNNNNLSNQNTFFFNSKEINCQVDNPDLHVIVNSLEKINIILDKNILYISNKEKESQIKEILGKLNKDFL